MKKNKELQQPKRSKVYDMRFTESEWNDLQKQAADFEMPISEYIRWSLFQRSVTMRILIDDETSALSKIKYQLDKIGNNINQISKAINSGIVNPEAFRKELKDMFRIIHDEVNLLNEVQAETHENWKKSISKHSRYYQIDKTEGIKK